MGRGTPPALFNGVTNGVTNGVRLYIVTNPYPLNRFCLNVLMIEERSISPGRCLLSLKEVVHRLRRGVKTCFLNRTWRPK